MSFARLYRRAPNLRGIDFRRIKNLEFDKEGDVEDFLNKQFTVNYEDGSFGFLMYADKGHTWVPIPDVKNPHKNRLRGERIKWSTMVEAGQEMQEELMDAQAVVQGYGLDGAIPVPEVANGFVEVEQDTMPYEPTEVEQAVLELAVEELQLQDLLNEQT